LHEGYSNGNPQHGCPDKLHGVQGLHIKETLWSSNMQPQLPQNLEVRGEDAVSGAGSGDSPLLDIDSKYSRDWWLYHFGVFVEPFETPSGVTASKLWRLSKTTGTPVFNVSYGDGVVTLWQVMNDMIKQA
jgi:hypothetical protein